MPRIPAVSLIIVTHHSEKVLPHCMEAVQNQRRPFDQVILVDSGSSDLSYLKEWEKKGATLVLAEMECGFSRANNLGMRYVNPSSDYVLFLNPDAFLKENFLEKGVNFMEDPERSNIGALGGLLLGFDLSLMAPSGKYDSTGIFQNWYGRWFDRDQGISYDPLKYKAPVVIPAICGALFFCRMKALKSVVNDLGEIFDRNFFMYKEDIDLSCRLRNQGWSLLFHPDLIAYHCRGWKNRRVMGRENRLHSARNELKVHYKQKSFYTLYSFLKYLSVKFLNL